jgi:hypothetical protein
MENEASQLIDKMIKLLANDDSETAWNIQEEIQRVRNSLKPYSASREKIDEIWGKMMSQWR